MSVFNFFTRRDDISDLREMFKVLAETQKDSFSQLQDELTDLRTELHTILSDATTVNKVLQTSVSTMAAALLEATEAVARLVRDDGELDEAYTARMEALRANLVDATQQAGEASTALHDQDAAFVVALDLLDKKSEG